MKLKFFLLLAFFIFPAIASAQTTDLIGYEHQGVVFGAKLPNGAKDQGGGLLSDEEHGVTRFVTKKHFMLWLERIVERDEETGVPTWQVKDVLTFPPLKKNQEFLLYYGSNCTRGGEEEIDMIVSAQFLPRTKTYKVNQAWLANVVTEQFEKISTKGIKCRYIKP